MKLKDLNLIDSKIQDFYEKESLKIIFDARNYKYQETDDGFIVDIVSKHQDKPIQTLIISELNSFHAKITLKTDETWGEYLENNNERHKRFIDINRLNFIQNANKDYVLELNHPENIYGKLVSAIRLSDITTDIINEKLKTDYKDNADIFLRDSGFYKQTDFNFYGREKDFIIQEVSFEHSNNINRDDKINIIFKSSHDVKLCQSMFHRLEDFNNIAKPYSSINLNLEQNSITYKTDVKYNSLDDLKRINDTFDFLHKEIKEFVTNQALNHQDNKYKFHEEINYLLFKTLPNKSLLEKEYNFNDKERHWQDYKAFITQQLIAITDPKDLQALNSTGLLKNMIDNIFDLQVTVGKTNLIHDKIRESLKDIKIDENHFLSRHGFINYVLNDQTEEKELFKGESKPFVLNKDNFFLAMDRLVEKIDSKNQRHQNLLIAKDTLLYVPHIESKNTILNMLKDNKNIESFTEDNSYSDIIFRQYNHPKLNNKETATFVVDLKNETLTINTNSFYINGDKVIQDNNYNKMSQALKNIAIQNDLYISERTANNWDNTQFKICEITTSINNKNIDEIINEINKYSEMTKNYTDYVYEHHTSKNIEHIQIVENRQENINTMRMK
ncbi:hypothetical protein [Campylobacter sp. RM12651]|uniref:hypothetical protein n=1 Tax=Campylobacter sp. RM12651 TaxID=1660079 RepID=UPI001EFB007E|nr:hypothetical protein [Campylobacter sp. RM12651]ULO04517.1 hypothetical protein AVBRAN_a0035 [Campylobacter sp. RM12651]